MRHSPSMETLAGDDPSELPAPRLGLYLYLCLSLLPQAGDPNQDHSFDEWNHDGTYHSATTRKTEQSEDPTTNNAAEDTQNDVYNHTVAAIFIS